MDTKHLDTSSDAWKRREEVFKDGGEWGREEECFLLDQVEKLIPLKTFLTVRECSLNVDSIVTRKKFISVGYV